MDKIRDGLIMILTGVFLIWIYSIPIYFLWNWLMVKIFLLPFINLIDACGFVVFMLLLKWILLRKVDNTIE